MTIPNAARPFIEFPSVLRRHGFSVAPDQTMGFIEAVGLLGPRGMDDIRRAAIAMLAVPRERETEFDALFRAFFLGQTIATPVPSLDEDEVEAHEPDGAVSEVEQGDELSDVGVRATAAERLTSRTLEVGDRSDVLVRFERLAPVRLPRRRSYRYAPTKRSGVLDLRRTLREAARRGGEATTLKTRRRRTRQRRVVLLIDISGSMRERTDASLRFAHALVQSAERVDVFTLGTRLTRITRDLLPRDRERALARVGQLVADFDGGTRIGEALRTFLDVPRYAGFARGALVLVLSDGLERGGPEAMIDSVHRLARVAWRLDWLSPLAGDPGYRPETSALSAVLGSLDALADGSGLDAICDHVLGLGRSR
ncbi:VWA domain-containing protein [Thalassobaculum sp.]|uniref:vWA domain-containing protein n=1 Tax=Thalassobaculum sp. TaxID=2022740 RepID=UPI0032EEE533